MIELLMVIMIISILGAIAVPQFLDFRNEARAASVQTALSAIRVGIKNQRQLATLKCGWIQPTTAPEISCAIERFAAAVYHNDITTRESVPKMNLTQNPPPTSFCLGPAFGSLEEVLDFGYYCKKSQVPNTADRRFITPGIAARISGTTNNLPDNPFLDTSIPTAIVSLMTATLGTNTKCGLVSSIYDAIEALAVRSGLSTSYIARVFFNPLPTLEAAPRPPRAIPIAHWIYLIDSDEIIAGTNTTGINECNF